MFTEVIKFFLKDFLYSFSSFTGDHTK